MLKPPPVRLTGRLSERSRYSSDFTLGSLTTITICADYICPWCYVALFQAKKLTAEYGVRFDWRGFELFPPGMTVPSYSAPVPGPQAAATENAGTAPPPPPPAPSRFDQFQQVEEITVPSPRPGFKRSHFALLGAEWALLDVGPHGFEVYNEAVYRAYWEQHKDISKLPVLEQIARDAGLDGKSLIASLTANRYSENVIPYDDESYAIGIRQVPTFIFGANERLAEANYTDLARATERFLLRAEKFQRK